MIFLILRGGYKAYIRDKDPLLIASGASTIALTLAMLFLSFATDPFISVKTAEIYWSFMAICAAILFLKAKTPTNIDSPTKKVIK
jgi:hypothetical protein